MWHRSLYFNGKCTPLPEVAGSNRLGEIHRIIEKVVFLMSLGPREKESLQRALEGEGEVGLNPIRGNFKSL